MVVLVVNHRVQIGVQPLNLTGRAGIMNRENQDWLAIKKEYRAGQLTVRAIAQNHGISHVAIIKKAKRENWERDLGQRIRDRGAKKLIVTTPVTKVTKSSKDDNKEVVEVPMSLKEKSEILRNLSLASSKSVPLGRKAYNLDAEEAADQTKKTTIDYEVFLAAIIVNKGEELPPNAIPLIGFAYQNLTSFGNAIG